MVRLGPGGVSLLRRVNLARFETSIHGTALGRVWVAHTWELFDFPKPSDQKPDTEDNAHQQYGFQILLFHRFVSMDLRISDLSHGDVRHRGFQIPRRSGDYDAIKFNNIQTSGTRLYSVS